MIKTARDVCKAVELNNTIPMLGLINDIVEVLIAEPHPTKNSVIIINTSFLFKLLYIFLLSSLSVLKLLNIFS